MNHFPSLLSTLLKDIIFREIWYLIKLLLIDIFFHSSWYISFRHYHILFIFSFWLIFSIFVFFLILVSLFLILLHVLTLFLFHLLNILWNILYLPSIDSSWESSLSKYSLSNIFDIVLSYSSESYSFSINLFALL